MGHWNQLTDTGRPNWIAASALAETKTLVWEEFGEAMKSDSGTASRRFWQTIRRLERGNQWFTSTVYSDDSHS